MNEFGDYIVLQTGKKVPVKLIAEQHIKEDCGFIPSVSDWLINMTSLEWMAKANNLSKIYENKKNDERSIAKVVR
jgi:hypothetical protein